MNILIIKQDETYSIEKVYTNHQPSYYANKMYGTDTLVEQQKMKKLQQAAMELQRLLENLLLTELINLLYLFHVITKEKIVKISILYRAHY